MQNKLLTRILAKAVEGRFGAGPEATKWKRLIHAIGYGASVRRILTGRI